MSIHGDCIQLIIVKNGFSYQNDYCLNKHKFVKKNILKIWSIKL